MLEQNVRNGKELGNKEKEITVERTEGNRQNKGGATALQSNANGQQLVHVPSFKCVIDGGKTISSKCRGIRNDRNRIATTSNSKEAWQINKENSDHGQNPCNINQYGGAGGC